MKLSKQLFLWFSLLLVTAIVLTLLLANKYINEAKVISRNKELITDLKLSYLSSNVLVSNFLSIESVNPQFFKTGTSSFIDQKFKKDSLIYSHFNLLKLQHVDEETRLKAIKTLEVNMNQQELLFTKMVHKVWERGYKDYGLVGRMRSHAHHLESVHQFDKELLLSLRRREKDFIIRHERQYIQNFDSIVAQIRHYVAKEKISADIKNNYLESLLQYAHCFHTLVDLDIELGVYNNSGLKASLDRFQFEAQNGLNLLQEQFNRDAEKALTQLKLFYILGAIALFVFCLTLSALLSKKITNPLVIFTQHLNSMSRLCFAQIPELELRRFSKEVKVLYQTFNRLISQLSVHETERNMLINKLVSSEEKYRNMADRLPQSVFETNVKGEFKYTNSHWQKSFGYKEAELGSQITLDKLIIKKKHSKEQARLNEVVAKRKDGSWFPALLYTDEIINEGQVKGVRGVVIDISDRYRYLKMLKAERRKAMAADKLKSAFIANVSHEVRTPLNAVLGYSHLLNDRLPKHVDDEGFIKQIIANGHQLLHLFDDIMDFSLIKTDLFQVKKSDLDQFVLCR